MTNPTDDDSIRELVEMGARDPEIRELLLHICELGEAHGREAVTAFMDTLREGAEFLREKEATERRAQFRVIEGGE